MAREPSIQYAEPVAIAMKSGIAQFDDSARTCGVFVLTGVSSFPVLTAAVTRRLAQGLARVDTISAGIAPSPFAGLGLNVIRSIASYCGKAFPLIRDGRAAVGHGLTESRRFTIAPPGRDPDVLRRIAAALPAELTAQISNPTYLEVTRRDYIRTAHAKGLRDRSVVMVHMIRNAMIPVVTILGPLLAFLITGSFIIETIFSVPGIGRYFVVSIGQRDYGVIMAMTMLYAGAIAVLNLVVDVLYAYIDPRIRYS